MQIAPWDVDVHRYEHEIAVVARDGSGIWIIVFEPPSGDPQDPPEWLVFQPYKGTIYPPRV